jgi:hypothetical protein
MRLLTILILVYVLTTVVESAFGQYINGTFFFSNIDRGAGIDAPVFDCSGKPLEGTNYLAMLYGGLASDSLQPAPPPFTGQEMGAPLSFRTGAGAGYLFYEPSAIREVIGVVPGELAWVQVRAWDARLGESYERAASLGIGGYGESNLLHIKSGGCFQCTHASLVGLQSFSLRRLTGVFITPIKRRADQIVIEWLGSAKGYQVQQTTRLGQSWENVGEPTEALSFTNNIAGTNLFFRVLGLPDYRPAGSLQTRVVRVRCGLTTRG